MERRYIRLAAALLLGLTAFTRPCAAVIVDTELSLLVDISTSVSATEFDAQLGGYESAFRSQLVRDKIADGPNGSIAVNLILWNRFQVVSVPWTLIDSDAAAENFADAIGLVTRPNNPVVNSTYIYSALQSVIDGDVSTGIFDDDGDVSIFANGFEGNRLVVDISGDGENNDPAGSSLQARNDLLAAGIHQINGLVVTDAGQNPVPIVAHYQNQVIGGTNAFVLDTDFSGFAAAIEQKLIFEISGENPNVPEPSSVLIWSLLAAVVSVSARRCLWRRAA